MNAKARPLKPRQTRISLSKNTIIFLLYELKSQAFEVSKSLNEAVVNEYT